MSFTKTGDWAKASKVFKDLERKGKVAARKTLMQVGLKGEQIVVDHLQKQDLGWQALSPRYRLEKMKTTSKKVRKTKKGLDDKRYKKGNVSEKILIRTSTYFSSITTFTKDSIAYVGVPKGKVYESAEGKRIEIANIAAVHEFGSAARNIPARPLFKPSREELKRWCSNNPQLAGAFIKDINDEL